MTTYCHPVLDLDKYIIWKGCGFLDPLYLVFEKAQHTGVDYNLRSGGDSDLGAPVYAIADGKITYMSYHRYIGNILLLELDDGSEAAYWHLDQFEENQKVGEKVRMGQRIATIGKGGKSPQYPRGRFSAHLHFEWRKKAWQCKPDEWPAVSPNAEAAKLYIRTTRYDPAKRLAELGALTTLSDVMAYYKKPELPAQSQPQERQRILVERADKTWQDVAGQRSQVGDVIVNATDPNTIYIRMDTNGS